MSNYKLDRIVSSDANTFTVLRGVIKEGDIQGYDTPLAGFDSVSFSIGTTTKVFSAKSELRGILPELTSLPTETIIARPGYTGYMVAEGDGEFICVTPKIQSGVEGEVEVIPTGTSALLEQGEYMFVVEGAFSAAKKNELVHKLSPEPQMLIAIEDSIIVIIREK